MIWRDQNITVHRSGRKKTMHIVIERDGSISVQAPESLTDAEILAILDRKEYEIFQKKALWEETHHQYTEKRFLPGQSFLYLGRNYNLFLMKGQRRNLLFRDGKFLLSDRALYPREDFIRFYKRQARTKILERIEIYKPQLAAVPQKISIKEMPTRWGSCTPTGNIYYNWRCVMAPLPILDYLIVHELVHLLHPDHSREFWLTLSTILPEYSYARDWLKTNGVRLDI